MELIIVNLILFDFDQIDNTKSIYVFMKHLNPIDANLQGMWKQIK